MSRITKNNSYKFLFPSAEKARQFLDIAKNNSQTKIVQHPLLGDGTPDRDKTVVLVTGHQSVSFDVGAIGYLENVAAGLAGMLVT